MIQLQSSLEKITVSRDMIREEHVETTRHIDNYNDYNLPYGAQTPSGGATPFRPQTPAHYGMNNVSEKKIIINDLKLLAIQFFLSFFFCTNSPIRRCYTATSKYTSS